MQLSRGRILITGGTGSLGTALVDHIHSMGWETQVTVLARNESRMALFLKKYPWVRGEIGDVRDLDWLRTIIPGHDLVIHAAAIKQVPTAESNVREAVLTNVIGSQNVAMASVESGVTRVVGVSTDKACAPHTTYGATKYLMEGIFREANLWSKNTSFTLVRYGNVLRSNASVVPLFEKQIADDVPFTVTDPDMTRFWITMGDAVALIREAAALPIAGVVLVPRPGAMRMYDLCAALDPKREIKIIGVRAGEKKHEVLIHEGEALHTSAIKNRFIIYPPDKLDRGNLPEGYCYSSASPDFVITPAELYHMLDSYNPYGGREWMQNSAPKA